MRLGLRTALLLTTGSALAGCLTSNPNLEPNESSAEDGSTAATDPTEGPTSGPSTTPTTGPTTGVPTTDGPTTVDPDTTDTETTDPSDTDETTGPASCGGGNVCVAEAPAGWAGPVVWAETPIADEAPECPAAYPELAFEAFDDLQAAPAVCDCECGTAGGASCATITLEYHNTDSACISPDDTYTINPSGSCTSGPSEGSGRYWEVADPGVSGGSCTPSASVEIADVAWNSQSTVCGGATLDSGSCIADQLCVSQPAADFESRLCVWQVGDLECPAGSYSDRFTRHASFEDDRNCSTCTCGDPEGECSGTVQLYGQSNCTPLGGAGISATVDIGGDCERGVTTSSHIVESARAGSLTVSNVACEPSVGTAIGEAEPDDPYTLCCLTVE